MTENWKEYLDVRPRVAAALQKRGPVVALETTVIAHGLPWPENLETARAVEAAIEAEGAVPATIGLCGGKIRVGLTEDELERFARERDAAKVSRRDIATVLAQGVDGATTVAGTLVCAALAGIQVMATGGIGGVHRGAEESFDISADLHELARQNVAVVSSGAKSILDLPRTLEVLETLGVPVLGFGVEEFPAFYARESGLKLEAALDGLPEVAEVLRRRFALSLGGVLVANPVPNADAIPRDELAGWIDQALAAAR